MIYISAGVHSVALPWVIVMTRRQLLALIAVLALLFAQVSSAAYACAPAMSKHTAAMSEECPGHAPADADTVCALHCDVGVSLPGAHAPDLAPVASAVLVVDLPAPVEPRSSFVPGSHRNAMATAPPAAIRFCRLLI